MLADEYGMHLISMGELVRMYVTGERRQQMLAGVLLDDNEIIAMIDRVLSTLEGDADCVLDGFPRTVPQAKWLMDQVKQGRFELSHVLHLQIGHDAVMSRLKARGRLDDKESVIEARLKEYERLTQPVIDWFDAEGVDILRVDGDRSTNVVNRDIIDQLQLS